MNDCKLWGAEQRTWVSSMRQAQMFLYGAVDASPSESRVVHKAFGA